MKAGEVYAERLRELAKEHIEAECAERGERVHLEDPVTAARIASMLKEAIRRGSQ